MKWLLFLFLVLITLGFYIIPSSCTLSFPIEGYQYGSFASSFQMCEVLTSYPSDSAHLVPTDMTILSASEVKSNDALLTVDIANETTMSVILELISEPRNHLRSGTLPLMPVLDGEHTATVKECFCTSESGAGNTASSQEVSTDSVPMSPFSIAGVTRIAIPTIRSLFSILTEGFRGRTNGSPTSLSSTKKEETTSESIAENNKTDAIVTEKDIKAENTNVWISIAAIAGVFSVFFIGFYLYKRSFK